MELPIHNVQMNHWNPRASMPLVLPVQVLCNTSDEEIHANIRSNSALDREWVTAQPAHDGVAILCGSGPSLADHLDEIKDRQDNGGTVFAMNGSAKFLAENGIFPDYQVMIDPREITAQLIGPARNHLFASQVHPACFKAVPWAGVWHLQVENIEDLFPPERVDQGGYALIGGSASVGNTATCLAYVMGYRNLQIYGYDSSHRDDKGHAFPQPMNDGDPSAMVEYGGKIYRASFTMKLQAEKFQDTAHDLKGLGCHIEVHGDGLLPAMFNRQGRGLSEVDKYRAMWSIGSYREVIPGKESAQEFIEMLHPAWDETVIDFGCGTGLGGLEISRSGTNVTLVDFADNCRDPEAEHLPFVLADLTKPMSLTAGYGYCTDVMEHIPPEQVDAVILNIMDCVQRCFFRIDFVDDVCGVEIGERLHLSVHPHEWWVETFERLGFIVPWSRDNAHHGLFHVTHRSHT